MTAQLDEPTVATTTTGHPVLEHRAPGLWDRGAVWAALGALVLVLLFGSMWVLTALAGAMGGS